MSQGFYGFPNILGLLRGTNLRVLGKAGATAGAGLAGGTTSGAPSSGQFDVGEAVIGADGTLFICTVAGSPGTWVQLGTLVDPLAARGDLLVRGASATTRLALGANGYVLQSNGTDAVWAVSPAGAGGALTQIAQTVLGSAAATISFSSIPGSYSALRLDIVAQTTQSVTDNYAYVQFNGDTGSNYDYTYRNSSDTTATWLQINATATTKINVADLTGATGPASSPGVSTLTIFGYAGTAWHKALAGQDYEKFGTSNNQLGVFGGLWRSTAAITSLQLSLSSGNFATSSVVTLYGLS